MNDNYKKRELKFIKKPKLTRTKAKRKIKIKIYDIYGKLKTY